MKKIKVIVVDDSLFIRKLFCSLLESDPEIEIIATANDPLEAREKIKETNPDVMTLDVEMPKMDGISFLEKVMKLRPMPVIMASTLTQKSADITIRALEIGAFDYIAKPTNMTNSDTAEHLKHELISKVKAAYNSGHSAPIQNNIITKNELRYNSNPSQDDQKIIALGASTGGVEALYTVLSKLPSNLPPIIITQHMPESFTKSFANRLDQNLNLNVYEATDNQKLIPGSVYIAPGNKHFKIKRRSGALYSCLDDGEKVSGHRPSVDVMFESVAKVVGSNCVAAILTGMGRDGADGICTIRTAGGYTIGQDQNTSVVYGMPKVAYDQGGVMKQTALHFISDEIVKYLCKKNEAA
jgi:two-component system, chemotaxis family, protein-glutamate methylesterase/glutaminase